MSGYNRRRIRAHSSGIMRGRPRRGSWKRLPNLCQASKQGRSGGPPPRSLQQSVFAEAHPARLALLLGEVLTADTLERATQRGKFDNAVTVRHGKVSEIIRRHRTEIHDEVQHLDKDTLNIDDAGDKAEPRRTLATPPYPEAHFATFPSAPVEPCVRAAGG